MPLLDHHVVTAFHPVQTKPEILEGTDGLPAIHRWEV